MDNSSSSINFESQHERNSPSSVSSDTEYSEVSTSWQEKIPERQLNKKRKGSPDKEWTPTGSQHVKNRKISREEEIKEVSTEEKHFQATQQCQIPALQMQHAPGSVAYDCNSATGFYVDPNQRNDPIPNQCNMFTSMNPQFQATQQCQIPALQMQQAPGSFAYDCNSATGFYVDPNQRNYPIPNQCNMFTSMNPQWGAGSLSVNSGMPMGTGMEMTSNAAMNPYPFVLPNHPSMFAMMPGMGGYGPYSMMNNQENLPPKTVVTLSSCVLYPPPPGAPVPSRRERPPGCKTVFVGGLPEKITEEIVKDAFIGCGEIDTIRMSKKNFCHIRFTCEAFVDKAMCYSGYRIKIENKDETAFSGRLHVDFAVARDDQYDYECLVRAVAREARHRESENNPPPTPPPVVYYTEEEATLLGEKLRNEETFKSAVQILTTWLERGECNRRNAGSFYSLIQSTNSHVRRLMNEKAKLEEEVRQAKAKLNQKCTANQSPFTDIEKVFDTAALQKVWDHFTKAQRKNLDMWRKQTKEIKESNFGDLISDRIEDEMELSDGEEDLSAKQAKEELNRCKEEIKLLRTQLRGAENEVILIRNEGEETAKVHKESCQKVQQQYEETKRKLEELSKLLRDKSVGVVNENGHIDNSHQAHTLGNSSCRADSGLLAINEKEICLVALIATFLNVHPFGISIDYICSYLVRMEPTVSARDVESLMKKCPSMFKEESTGIGATLEKKWTFLAGTMFKGQ